MKNQKTLILYVLLFSLFLSKSIYSDGFGYKPIKCEVGDIIFFGEYLDDSQIQQYRN